MKRGERNLARALAWLKRPQDPHDGSWPAVFMNKNREPSTMPAGYVRDTDMAFAVLALTGE